MYRDKKSNLYTFMSINISISNIAKLLRLTTCILSKHDICNFNIISSTIHCKDSMR
jgi:hypothetical protein